MQDSLVDEVADPKFSPTFNAHEWAVPLSAFEDNQALKDQLTILSTSTDA